MDYHEFLRKHHDGEPFTVDDVADAIESLLDEMDRTIEELDRKKEDRQMGAFDVVPNITIPDPDDLEASKAFRKKWKWEPHEQVIIKGTYAASDYEAVQNASSPSASAQQGHKVKEVEARVGSGHLKILERMIVDWTLAQNGRKVEVTPQAIRRLPGNYLTPILEKCDEVAAGMNEEEQNDFLDGANEPTKENSKTTK